MNDMTPGALCDPYGIPLLGSRIVRVLARGEDGPLMWNELLARAKGDATDFSALMDIGVFLQNTEQVQKGHEIQKAAVGMKPVFRRIFGDGTGLKVLSFVTAVDIIANTPIEFLLEASDVTLYYVYVDAEMTSLPELPPCDVAFVAVGESPMNNAVLSNLRHLLHDWAGPPIMNGALERIAMLSRDHLYRKLLNEPTILSPEMIKVERNRLVELSMCEAPEKVSPAALSFPIIVRPIGTHCGDDQERILSAQDLAVYLQSRRQSSFYVSRFIDYRRPDGLYRKMRIAVLNGVPYACHLAVSEHWKVHYLSADMHLHSARRDEEARWMESFDVAFAERHSVAIAAIARCFGVEYFCIDCAEMDDGRLLVFEADTMMIVHDLDAEELYPYKKPTMHKLFRAFQGALVDMAAAPC